MEEQGGNETRTQEHTHKHTYLKKTVGQENLLPVITLSVGWLSLCLLAPSVHNTTDQVTLTPTQRTHHFSLQSNDLTHWYCLCVCKCLSVNFLCNTEPVVLELVFTVDSNLPQVFICILLYTLRHQ